MVRFTPGEKTILHAFSRQQKAFGIDELPTRDFGKSFTHLHQETPQVVFSHQISAAIFTTAPKRVFR